MAGNLQTAIIERNLAACKALVGKKPALLEGKGKRKSDVVPYAVNFGNLEIVKFLVESGGDVTATDNRGYGPLKACLHGFGSGRELDDSRLPIFKYLLTLPSARLDSSVLDEFVNWDDLPAIERVMEAVVQSGRAAEEVVDGSLRAYLAANPEKHAGAVLKKYLPRDPFFADDPSAEVHAIFSSKVDKDALDFLASYSGDINARDKVGRTPLIMACINLCRVEIVQALLERGADVSVVDGYGADACFYAIGYILEHRYVDQKVLDPLMAGNRSPGAILFHEAVFRGAASFSFRCGECREPVSLRKMPAFLKKREATDRRYTFSCPHCGKVIDFSMILPDARSAELLAAMEANGGGLPVVPKGDTMEKAIQRGDMASIRAQVAKSRGALEKKGKDGGTPLVAAVGRGSIEIAGFLLDSGAKPLWAKDSILDYALSCILFHQMFSDGADQREAAAKWAIFDYLLARPDVPLTASIVLANLDSSYPKTVEAAFKRIASSGRPLEALHERKILARVGKKPDAPGAKLYRKHFG